MSPAEIEATIHEAELKNRAGGRDTRYCNWATCCSRSPSLVDRQRVAKGSHENRILLAGLHWDEVEIRQTAAPQSLRSLIGKLCRPSGSDGALRHRSRVQCTIDRHHGATPRRGGHAGATAVGAAAQPAIDGRTVTMTLDLDLQQYATTQLQEAVASCHAAGGRLMVLDVATGGLFEHGGCLVLPPREGDWPGCPNRCRPKGRRIGRSSPLHQRRV